MHITLVKMCYLQEVFKMKYTVKAVIIGIVQGITEFLPVSSSGHIEILKTVFGLSEEGAAFDVLLHVGTLIAVCVFYRKDIRALSAEIVQLCKDIFSGNKIFNRERPYRVLLIMLALTTLPTVVVGVLFENLFDSLFSNITAVGCSLLITSVLLYISNKLDQGTKNEKSITLRDALVVGIMQSCAITPGISRSGATVFAGRLSGFEVSFAVKYSFLCSLPTILGALVLKSKDFLEQSISNEQIVGYVFAFVAAAIVGYLSLRMLDIMSKKRNMKWFSVYCLCIGMFCIVYGVIKHLI